MSLLIQSDPALERRKKLAEAMLQRGQRTGPVSHWAEGLSRVIDQGAGAYFGNKAAQEESARKKASMESLAKAISGDGMAADGMGPPQPLMSRLAGVKDINPEALAMLKLEQAVKPTPRDPVADALAIAKGKKAIEGDPSGFEGTNLDAQAMNILMDNSIPENDPRKEFSRQRLTQPTTIATPEGTRVRPGMDLSFLGGGSQAQTGAAEDLGELIPKQATEAQAKNAGFYKRMMAASGEISKLGDYNPVTPGESFKGLTNFTASENKQRYNQAADEWIRAKLRKESGAAIPPDERDQEYATYFPKFGDKPPVIAQKERTKRVAEEAMLDGASPEFIKDLRIKHAKELAQLESNQTTGRKRGRDSVHSDESDDIGALIQQYTKD